ncbi:MAG: hypothetical protein ABIH72_01305 [archaeon]
MDLFGYWFWFFWLFIIVFTITWLLVELSRYRKRAKDIYNIRTDKYKMILKPHVETALKRGTSKEELRAKLIEKKWPIGIINSVLSEF